MARTVQDALHALLYACGESPGNVRAVHVSTTSQGPAQVLLETEGGVVRVPFDAPARPQPKKKDS